MSAVNSGRWRICRTELATRMRLIIYWKKEIDLRSELHESHINELGPLYIFIYFFERKAQSANVVESVQDVNKSSYSNA